MDQNRSEISINDCFIIKETQNPFKVIKEVIETNSKLNAQMVSICEQIMSSQELTSNALISINEESIDERVKKTINELPNEILFEIFDFLDFECILNVNKVCDKWHQIIIGFFSCKTDIVIEDNDFFETMDEKLLSKFSLNKKVGNNRVVVNKRIVSLMNNFSNESESKPNLFRRIYSYGYNKWQNMFESKTNNEFISVLRDVDANKPHVESKYEFVKEVKTGFCSFELSRKVIVINVQNVKNYNKSKVIRDVLKIVFLLFKNIKNFHLFISALNPKLFNLINEYKQIRTIGWKYTQECNKRLFSLFLRTIGALPELRALYFGTFDTTVGSDQRRDNCLVCKRMKSFEQLSHSKKLIYICVDLCCHSVVQVLLNLELSKIFYYLNSIPYCEVKVIKSDNSMISFNDLIENFREDDESYDTILDIELDL